MRKEAKHKILGYTAIKKIKLRQRSRLTWIKVGDANTKLFHLRVNARRRRNHIPLLKHQGVTCITQEAKAATLQGFFTKQLGSTTPREHTLNWSVLRPGQHDRQYLDREVTEGEIKAAVMHPLKRHRGQMST
jgi:hypothetical protein